MATTTPNYGWAVPTSTDLVKDGATAIETLGDSIDASLVDLRGGTTGQVLKKASATQMDFEWGSAGGLTLINTTSFSAVSSQSINDVFSTTYDNYMILLQGASSANADFLFRLRVSGADASGATDYVRPGLVNNKNSATVLNSGGVDSSSGYIGVTGINRFAVSTTFFNPFLAQPTLNVYQNYGNEFQGFGANSHKLSTSYTGITVYPSSGTMTGIVSIFGFNK
jgi:hypothetical protein